MTDRKLRTTLLALVVAVGVASTVGIGGVGAVDTDNETTDGYLSDEKVDSYAFDTETESSTVIVENGEETETTGSADGTGVVDVENERMERHQTVTTVVDGTERTRETTPYLVDGVLYTDSLADEESGWMKMEFDEEMGDVFGQSHQLAQYRTLAAASDAEVVGEEDVDGTSTTVVEYTPDWEEYTTMMREEMGSTAGGDDATTGEGGEMMAGEDAFQDLYEEFDVAITMWINDETGLPEKVVTEASVTMDGDDLAEANGTTADGLERSESSTATTVYFDDYNEDVEVELPADAENATDFEEQFGDVDGTNSDVEDGEAVDETEESDTVDESDETDAADESADDAEDDDC